MKQLLLLLAIALLGAACGSSSSSPIPSLSDYCGETAVTSRDISGSHSSDGYSHFFLSFPAKKTAGLVTVEVTEDEYNVYKDGTRPVDCPETLSSDSLK